MKDKYTASSKQSGIIYRITNEANGWVYIGSTLNERERLGRHIRHLRKNKHFNKRLQEDFNEFGEESFTFEVIERNIKEDDLHMHERSHIVVNEIENNSRIYNTSKAARISRARRYQLNQTLQDRLTYRYRYDLSGSINQ